MYQILMLIVIPPNSSKPPIGEDHVMCRVQKLTNSLETTT